MHRQGLAGQGGEKVKTLFDPPLHRAKMVGRCDVVVDHYLQYGCPGIRRDGVWTGQTAKTWGLRGRWRQDAQGRPVHVWIELPDGTVLDPTRWTFEGVWPYVYQGPADFYGAAVLPLEPAE